MDNENKTSGMRNYLLLVLKGCAMGAADVVPGVSGGTIAFITGIYEELINSIKSCDFQAFKLLASGRFRDFWDKINGSFLVSVVAGILISIFSLAKLMTFLLNTYPIYVWSFFFGLIIASTVLVARTIKKWNFITFFGMALGIVTAYTITVLTPANTPETWWYIVLSGAIAICAMILPGISGAFILLLLGKYAFIMQAVHELQIEVILLFALGALLGIVSFAHLLSWLLKNYHTATIALLTGFMMGSLNKIWPWKQVTQTYLNANGIEKVLTETNVSPTMYQAINNVNPQVWGAILMCVIGFLTIWGVERIGNRYRESAE
ncbi:MAG: DUF368 domain-containing protein [Marinifilaceae bacterium]